MNPKLLIAILIVALLGGVWFFNGAKTLTSETAKVANNKTAEKKSVLPTETLTRNESAMAAGSGEHSASKDVGEDEEAEPIPAAQRYHSAEEALAAVKKASLDYDDFILEEFVELGDCAWCDKFYPELLKSLRDPSLSIDERSYFGELLAVSGKLDNIKELVKSLEQAGSDDERDMYGESLELAVGGDDMIQVLSEYMSNENDTLRESVVSAISNQGSRLAAEKLYNDLVSGQGKDHDYYSLGIGLGEMVPDESALPFLQELVIKRAPHSDLAVKALINSGLPGLTIVFDSLASEKDEAKGTEMLKDAVDHVITEDGVIDFLTKASQNQAYPQFLKEFANNALTEAKAEEVDEEEEEE